MNVSRSVFFNLSLSAMAALVLCSDSDAGVRITNSALMKNQAQQAMAERAAQIQSPQPVRTATSTDSNGETTSVVSETDMNACSMIYPTGRFDWLKPTTGTKRGGPATCVALVELRSYQNAAGRDYKVLASAYLAAGDIMKCNIDDFHDITSQGREFEYPADAEPTVEDVAKVMAEENKQNSGFKILAAAVVGGLGGNLLGKGEKGDDSALGLGGEKLKTTAIGAAGAAALMTASTQVNDYKAGSMILSTGVNAAAGAAAGNLMSSGDEILKIDKCNIEGQGERYCVYGLYNANDVKKNEYTFDADNIFYDFKEQVSYKCEKSSKRWKNCQKMSLAQIVFDIDTDAASKCPTKTGKGQLFVPQECIKQLENLQASDTTPLYGYETEGSNKFLKEFTTPNSEASFVKIATARDTGRQVSAMIEVSEADAKKFFGYKIEKWGDLKAKLPSKTVYDLKGRKIELTNGSEYDIDNFTPARQAANDGDVIDFNNKARTKSTLVGAGGGAALGALAGASGADAEIQERWVTAVREYNDSLGNISCSTGDRWLSKYNDMVIIPEMKTAE